jgi:hypothetical protein
MKPTFLDATAADATTPISDAAGAYGGLMEAPNCQSRMPTSPATGESGGGKRWEVVVAEPRHVTFPQRGSGGPRSGARGEEAIPGGGREARSGTWEAG